MKQFLLGLCLFMTFGLTQVEAQKYFTREGKISFYSDTPIEKIEAHNQKATCILDVESGKMEFAVLVKAFQFEKALMQEHFNENYMESGAYPKSVFKGQIANAADIDFSKDGTYDVTVEGELTIHGVAQSVSTPGQITVAGDKISATAKFETKPEDHDIKIPSVVRKNIAEIVQIDVNVALEPFKR
ncbi:MAG: YceI family protein [Saprospiraceae bacterium]|nr:YceI family protein [Saprospiraceae bacterium]